jgi:hypothetical protein
MPAILAAVRFSEEQPERLRELRPLPTTPRPPRLMGSTAAAPAISKIEPFENYPHPVRLDHDD